MVKARNKRKKEKKNRLQLSSVLLFIHPGEKVRNSFWDLKLCNIFLLCIQHKASLFTLAFLKMRDIFSVYLLLFTKKVAIIVRNHGLGLATKYAKIPTNGALMYVVGSDFLKSALSSP